MREIWYVYNYNYNYKYNYYWCIIYMYMYHLYGFCLWYGCFRVFFWGRW